MIGAKFRQIKTWVTTNNRWVILLVVVAGLVFVSLTDSRTTALVMYGVLTLLACTFTALYASRSNWRATEPGRALLYLVAMFATLAFWLAVSFWLGTRYGDAKNTVREILLIVLIVMFLNLVLTLRRIQQFRVEQVKIEIEADKRCPNEKDTSDA